MSRKPVYTAALMGTGRIGFTLGFDKKREQPASHTMALRANKRIKLIAACDTDAIKLENWKRYCSHATTYSSYGHLLAACSPDIIVIAVNEDAHLDTALAAIRSKPKLIILEKPVALTMKDGLAIADEAKKNDVPIMVNHERRFALDYKIAKSYMKKIGELQSITAELCSSLRVYSKQDEASGEYSLLHDGTHLIDIVHYLLTQDHLSDKTASSDLQRRSILYDMALESVFRDKSDISIVRNISVHFASDVCPDVTIKISGRSKFFSFGIDVLGTEGRIKIGNGYAEFYKREAATMYTGFYSLVRDDTVALPTKTKYFSNMVQAAVDFLDGTLPLMSTLQDGLNDLDIIEQIRCAIRENT
ncbi:MAG: Gfo/Idh/MocA family oxidoreductase [Treponema sp.]|nr:Gfo/Idh/MocA family oxidoreductase [Treponema sp.]